MRPISLNTALFSLIGTAYGSNGIETFALPDLHGQVAVHEGQGGGLIGRVIDERSGTETITLVTPNLPPHIHPMAVSTRGYERDTGSFVASGSATVPTGPSSDVLDATSIRRTGSNLPHENMQP